MLAPPVPYVPAFWLPAGVAVVTLTNLVFSGGGEVRRGEKYTPNLPTADRAFMRLVARMPDAGTRLRVMLFGLLAGARSPFGLNGSKPGGPGVHSSAPGEPAAPSVKGRAAQGWVTATFISRSGESSPEL